MIDSRVFINKAKAAGFDFFTGVPCSLFTKLITTIESEQSVLYAGATSEGEACGIAAGSWLAGRTPVVMLQNSGLGNTINPLTSLNHPFRIPMLLLVTWRGEPGDHDEPQHELMGRSMHGLLDAISIPHAPLPETEAELDAALATARSSMESTRSPYALIVRKGQFHGNCQAVNEPSNLPAATQPVSMGAGDLPGRFEVLSAVDKLIPSHAVVIATTGKTGRELYTVGDRARNFYVVGSMGCASAIGLGISLFTDRPVVVLDGDGAALMKLGNMATIGRVRPKNFIHVLLDNGVHDSTGGQATASSSVDFARLAAACSYASATTSVGVAAVSEALRTALGKDGPHFIRASIRPGSIEALGRPTIGPADVALRLRGHITAQDKMVAAA